MVENGLQIWLIPRIFWFWGLAFETLFPETEVVDKTIIAVPGTFPVVGLSSKYLT